MQLPMGKFGKARLMRKDLCRILASLFKTDFLSGQSNP